MNFSDNLKKIRRDNNLSQEQLAEKLGVSRQSVSKWESGQAYPEMEKMLQLCKLFNLNIDDLLNQDIKEINKNKQFKLNINKYLDDVLSYITKTLDMFSSLKLKQKVKCIFEQMFIIGFLTLIMLILGGLSSSIFSHLFSFLPGTIYYFIYNFFTGLYLIFSVITIIIVELHIFKVRYLDYYDIIYEDENNKLLEEKESKKIILEKKQDKIVIRNPKDTGYGFIAVLFKCLIFFVKLFALFIFIFVTLIFIFLLISLIVSFLFIKTVFLFIGILMGIVGCILCSLLILYVLYNFIVSINCNKKIIFLNFIISIILIAAGVGLCLISVTRFDYIDNIENTNNYEKIEKNILMNENLIIFDYYDEVTYEESNNNDIKIIIEQSNTHNIEIINEKNYIYFNHYYKNDNIFECIRLVINDINDYKLVNYNDIKITVRTNKKNIDKLKSNLNNYYTKQEENEYQTKINEYEDRIIELEEKLYNLEEECID